MTLAKCLRCGASATGESYEKARSIINHAVGLSRGIPCGDNYNCVEEIVDTIAKKSSPQTPKTSIPKDENSVTKTEETLHQKAKSQSTEHVTVDEAKPSEKKSKNISN